MDGYDLSQAYFHTILDAKRHKENGACQSFHVTTSLRLPSPSLPLSFPAHFPLHRPSFAHTPRFLCASRLSTIRCVKVALWLSPSSPPRGCCGQKNNMCFLFIFGSISYSPSAFPLVFPRLFIFLSSHSPIVLIFPKTFPPLKPFPHQPLLSPTSPVPNSSSLQTFPLLNLCSL